MNTLAMFGPEQLQGMLLALGLLGLFLGGWWLLGKVQSSLIEWAWASTKEQRAAAIAASNKEAKKLLDAATDKLKKLEAATKGSKPASAFTDMENKKKEANRRADEADKANKTLREERDAACQQAWKLEVQLAALNGQASPVAQPSYASGNGQSRTPLTSFYDRR